MPQCVFDIIKLRSPDVQIAHVGLGISKATDKIRIVKV